MLKKLLSAVVTATVLATSAQTLCFASSANAFGDCNADGKINSVDAILLLKHAIAATSGKTVLTGNYLPYADINGDGKVSSADAVLVLKYTVYSLTNSGTALRQYIDNPPPPPEPPISLTALETEMLNLFNNYRKEQGLEPFQRSTFLCETADIRAKEIIVAFESTGSRPNTLYRPDGKLIETVFDEVKTKPSREYEVEFWVGGASAQSAFNSLTALADFKTFIENASSTHIGVGYHPQSTAQNPHFWVIHLGS
jgi:hypothetical protein